jgi:hypothetical protein
VQDLTINFRRKRIDVKVYTLFAPLVYVAFLGCPKSNFSGGKPIAKPTSAPSPAAPPPPEVDTVGGVSPSVAPPKVMDPIKPNEECFGREHRALRIAFIVDNSGSMSVARKGGG